ncbi:MAG: TRAP transporter small permease subunit [Alphaproteobacteria bacterium]|nr:TRAP transporter small permease subunit [Alphaproteobacteria bacterium]
MAILSGIVFLLQQIALGFVNLVLAPYNAALWVWGILTADSRAEVAAAKLAPLEIKLTETGELSAFEAAIDGQPDILAAAAQAVDSGAIAANTTEFLEFVRLKSLAVEFPADTYIVSALLYWKSSEFFFSLAALVIGLLIAGLIYRPILRGVAGGINAFNGTLGKLASWFALLMAFQQIMIIFLQQVFRANGLPISFFGLELVPGDDILSMPWFATELLLYNAIIIAFACAYTFLEEAHVRVDLIYGAMNRRVRHWMDVVGTLIFLLPSMVGLWWVCWSLAMNKMFQITSFNPLTSQILTRNFEGRISGISSFKQLNWNTSTGENFSHVPLYYILLLVLAALMTIQAVGFMFSSIDKGLTTNAENDRKARELEDGGAIRNADTAVATTSETKAPEAESKSQGDSKKTVSDDASQPALGSA